MIDPFRMPEYALRPGAQYRKIEDAPSADPPVPDFVEVVELPSDGTVNFVKVGRTDGFNMDRSQFREIYDPA